MTTIKILPEILSNQIAAGEVVERPVSIVKELVENSIDANASSITIEAVNGGKSLIRISDDGIGLSRDDALLAIERYATSKIYSKEDLFSIATMGFRGEALPSIASVSKFTLVTRVREDDIGTRIDMAGGKILNVSDAGAPVGTMAEVKSLFFNTPARKKFLKSDATENSHISDAIFGLALGHADVRFRLFTNQKIQKNFSQSDDLFQRCVHIFGKDAGSKLYSIEYSDPVVKIRGYCSNPLLTRSTSSKIYLFVNQRLIYDRGLISAIFKGYRGRLMKGRFPVGAFFIDIGFDQVDVNVHPSKREVKFFNARQVYRAMAMAVENTLVREQQDMAAYSQSAVSNEPVRERLAGKFEFGAPVRTDGRHKESVIDPFIVQPKGGYPTYHPDDSFATVPSTPGGDAPKPAGNPAVRQGQPDHGRFTGKTGHGSGGKEAPAAYDSLRVSPSPPAALIHEQETVLSASQADIQGSKRYLTVIGQILGTYILAESDDGLVMIDQHAAHERIAYERLKKRHTSLGIQSQGLVVPEMLDLNFREADTIVELLPDLNALGFDIEPFGGTTFAVKAVPVMIDKQEVKQILQDIIDAALVKKDETVKEKWLEECLILMACHGAVRANKKMTSLEMEALVKALEACENPRHCPHGRPIQVVWSKTEIERIFKRVV